MWELDTSGYLRDAQARPTLRLAIFGLPCCRSCDLTCKSPPFHRDEVSVLTLGGAVRCGQKCINGSTSCELFYCATATPLA